MAYRRSRSRSRRGGRRSGGYRSSYRPRRRANRFGGGRRGGQTVRLVIQGPQPQVAFPGMTLPAVTPTGLVNASAPNPRRARF